MNKVRSSNFELMRIISMIFIILWHILMHGNVINNAANPALSKFLDFIMFIIVVHVNSFVLVFGYFQSKSHFKISKLFKLIFQVIFYSIVILFVAVKLKWITDYNIVTLIENILPSCISNYWFINAYIIIYIFSDSINLVISKLSRKEYKYLLIILFIMLSIVPYITGMKIVGNNGYNYIHFFFLYLIGGYLKNYSIKDSYHFKNFSMNGYRLFLVFIFFTFAFVNYTIFYFANSINGLSNLSNFFASRIIISKISYANPLVIIQTLVYFEFFKTLKLKSKIINLISGNVFGIYLFHDNNYMRGHIYKILKIDSGTFYGYRHLIYVIFGLIIIFVVGWIIEMLRKLFFKLFAKLPLTKKIKIKFKNFANSFNIKIPI